MKVDLGCGSSKTAGFVGVDRFPLSGVEVVCDLNQGIPFANDSVDYLLASTMQEIFRVCRDRAIVTIISPYYATGLNHANPYHKQVFNEHTSRFFTAHEAAPRVAREEYTFPHADAWGLGQSDHSNWSADLRPLHVDYFYFGPYRVLDEASKRELRKHLSDVCDQMLTHLLVVKTPISEGEFAHVAETAQFHETEFLRLRRQLELQEGESDAFSVLPGLPKRLDALEQELMGLAAALSAEVKKLQHRIDQGEAELRESERAAAVAVATLEHALARAEGQLAEVARRTTTEAAAVATLEHALARAEGQLAEVARRTTTEGRRLNTFVTRLMRNFITPRSRGERAARILRELLLPMHDLAHDVAVADDPLLEASLLGNGVTSAYRLRLTSYLVEGDQFVYPITLRDERVHAVDLRLFVLNPPIEKVHLLHLDLYDPEAGQVLRSADVVADDDELLHSVRATFPPLAIDGARELQVRLLGMDAARTAGLRMLEWRHPRLFSRKMYDRRLFGRVVRARA
jgi:hypothetical protein